VINSWTKGKNEELIKLLALLILSTISYQSLAATALVYKGSGSCDEGCSESAALMASLAGLQPIYVGPRETDPAIFQNARVWIQPGGEADVVVQAMAPKLRHNIKAFIAAGGGYVGFCAGAFLAADKIEGTLLSGLGLIPGRAYTYNAGNQPDVGIMLPVLWGSKWRDLYFEQGAAFQLTPNPLVQAVGAYPDGSIAAVRTLFYHGRVFVIGAHPEAPDEWKEYFHLVDKDGRDWDMAVTMIKWAGNLH